MICTHTFIRINETSKPRPGQGVSMNGMIEGAIAGCIHCGQVRSIYTDGQVKILVQGGEPINEDHVGTE